MGKICQDAFQEMVHEEDDNDHLDRPDARQELKEALAQIRKKKASMDEQQLLNIIQEKCLEEEST